MSAGDFESSKYELSAENGGYIGKIRVQPETLAATFNATANAAPVGATNMPGSVKVSRGKRELGVGARSATIRFTSTPPDGYSGDDVTIPILTPATAAAWTDESTGTYLGVAAKIISKSPESVK